MGLTALDRKLLRELRQQGGQLLAIALVVACGIAIFVLSRSAYHSLQLTQTAYYDRYRFAHVFAELKRAPASLQTAIAAIPGVAQVQTRIVADVTLDVPGLVEPATGRLIAIPPRQQPMLNDVFIRAGRYPDPTRREEVLVSEAFAQANQLQLGGTLGAILNGRWQRLRIVGIALSPEYVYEIPGAGSLYPDNRRFGVIWMGREGLGRAFDLDGAFNNVALTLLPGASEAAVIAHLDRLLTPYGGLGAYGRADQVSHRILADEIQSLAVSATIVPSLFLGIAAFLLHVVLSRLVATQRDQIAVLKAFGYSNGAIGWHYLKFVLTIVGLGAILGISAGMGLGQGMTRLYAEFFHFPILRYEAGTGLIMTALLVSGGAAIAGGWVAVQQATRLPPAEGMRPEPPAMFRPTIVERLGLQQAFSPAGRMILRNLERKPMQALLSLLGIAIAASILVVGFYLQTAIQVLLEVQFNQVQREDVTIVFNQPRSARVRYDIPQLPGVLQAEVFRIVPVRLRFGHRQYRIALTGIQPNSQFRRLIDRDRNRVSLPPQGVVLTSKLAEILGVRPGQTLTVEVLEGDRPVRQVAVAGTVDELLGVSAYLDIRALNALMREGQTVSGAYLQIDPRHAETLYQRLKQMPAIAGVSFRTAMLRSFEELSGQNLKVFTTVLILFACIITFSVVYNSGRIALAERSRELASLRIMGFTQGEVSTILLGEQAIVTVAALPVGILIGIGFSALMARAYDSELYRLPLVFTNATYVITIGVVLLAAIVSSGLIRYQLDRLDLIAVLKTRE